MTLDWILQIAASGGAALVGAAATDAWSYARTEFARLLGRGDSQREEIAARKLDGLAREIEQAEPAQRDEIRARRQAAWQVRLEDLVEDDTAVANDLAAVVERLRELLPAEQNAWVQNITASAPNATAQGVQHGNIINHYSGPSPSS